MTKGKQEVLLSLLIPTLENRKVMLKRMTDHIEMQRSKLSNPNEVQVLLYTDQREKTTGFKRNVLLGRATGLFTVFVDDDDKLSDDYLYEIIKAIKENPDIDCIGIQGKYSENQKDYEPFETSLKHNWEKKNGWYLRTINHISPIKREHAITVLFPNKTRFEDYEWTMALKATGLLKKEVVIKKPLYIYDYIHDKNY